MTSQTHKKLPVRWQIIVVINSSLSLFFVIFWVLEVLWLISSHKKIDQKLWRLVCLWFMIIVPKFEQMGSTLLHANYFFQFGLAFQNQHINHTNVINILVFREFRTEFFVALIDGLCDFIILNWKKYFKLQSWISITISQYIHCPLPIWGMCRRQILYKVRTRWRASTLSNDKIGRSVGVIIPRLTIVILVQCLATIV